MSESVRAEQLGESRAAFMARVRQAVGRRGQAESMETAPEVDEALVRLVSPQDDVVELFTRRATAAGMRVYHVDNTGVAGTVTEIVRAAGAGRVAVAVDGLMAHLREAGATVVDRVDGNAALWELDAAVTGVTAAIAETGTLVCCSDAQQGRLLSLLAPVHVAIVRSSDVVADMLDYWDRFGGDGAGPVASSQVMITGPSKTSDIEGVLITGVHGPGEVHVVVVDP